MQAWSRRKFAIIGTVAGAAAIGGLAKPSGKKAARGSIRLQAVDGAAYSESFLRFMERAKFDSVRDAVASIRDRSVPVRIVHVEST